MELASPETRVTSAGEVAEAAAALLPPCKLTAGLAAHVKQIPARFIKEARLFRLGVVPAVEQRQEQETVQTPQQQDTAEVAAHLPMLEEPQVATEETVRHRAEVAEAAAVGQT